MRVVVTGGRDYTNKEVVWEFLNELHGDEQVITFLVTGACHLGGADLLAEQWAKAHEVPYMGMPAKFKTGKRGAGEGPLRNAAMLDTIKPDLVVAFPGGTGTGNCIKLAYDRGIRVKEVK